MKTNRKSNWRDSWEQDVEDERALWDELEAEDWRNDEWYKDEQARLIKELQKEEHDEELARLYKSIQRRREYRRTAPRSPEESVRALPEDGDTNGGTV